jgi:hypothetical protein
MPIFYDKKRHDLYSQKRTFYQEDGMLQALYVPAPPNFVAPLPKGKSASLLGLRISLPRNVVDLASRVGAIGSQKFTDLTSHPRDPVRWLNNMGPLVNFELRNRWYSLGIGGGSASPPLIDPQLFSSTGIFTRVESQSSRRKNLFFAVMLTLLVLMLALMLVPLLTRDRR